MKIRRLHVQNMKLLRDFRLDFIDPSTGQPRSWTVLVGRNARGKSTILQAIALAAAGRDGALQLLSGHMGTLFDRRQDPRVPVQIDAEFSLPSVRGHMKHRKGVPLRELPETDQPQDMVSSTLTLRPASRGQGEVVGTSWYGDWTQTPPHTGAFGPINAAQTRSLPWWFTVAYGVGRQLRLPQASDALESPTRVRQKLAPLFSPLVPVGIGYADDKVHGIAGPFMKLLKKVLLHHEGLVPLISDLELRGAGGVRSTDQLADGDKFQIELPGGAQKMPATWLSHGYQATLAWVADLVGQFLLDWDGTKEPADLSGLVLIDELDLFLHPDWQAGFIQALSATFPNLQFVATTHSPLLISKLEPGQVILLDWNEAGNIVARPFEADPRLMTATDLYREIFGITDPPPTDLARDLVRCEYLGADPERTDAEDAEVQALLKSLAAARVRDLPVPVPRIPTP